MANNAELGMTIQKVICEKYGLTPHEKALKQFCSSYNPIYKGASLNVINSIFSEIDLIPIECVTFVPSNKNGETLTPHNFILSDGSTLSIRTNLNGDKIAPRVVGQAGIDTFNEHFSDIAGYEISDKNEIKAVVFEKIHKMIPVFIDYFFLSDYTVWIQLTSNNTCTYTIIDKNSFVDINLERACFSFTRDLSNWNESTTLKYNGKSLAEIQIHKNRTFKFRFIMNTLVNLLVEQKITNETFGITAEKVICDIFGIPVPKEYNGRFSVPMSYKIRPTIEKAFNKLPRAIKSTGAEKGKRGKNSKCPYDFLLEGNLTLSLKTNSGNMICPPDVGQPGASTCYYYFGKYIDGEEVTELSFKKMVYTHIADIIPIYISHLFDSNFLLWVYKDKEKYNYKIFDMDYAKNAVWKPELFSFTKSQIDMWNESNTVKYDGISIGEFQVHKKRTCFKFRFNMENLELLINTRF